MPEPEFFCPLCPEHPKLIQDEGQVVCHGCGYYEERPHFLLDVEAQNGRQYADQDLSRAVASSRYAGRTWARSKLYTIQSEEQSLQHVRQLIGRLASRIPAVASAATPALRSQAEQITMSVRKRAKNARKWYRALKGESNDDDDDDSSPEQRYLDTLTTSTAAALVTDEAGSDPHAPLLIRTRINWGTRSGGNALLAAALFSVLQQAGAWIPLAPLAVVAETTINRIRVQYLLLCHLYPTMTRIAIFDPRHELPGLMARLRVAQTSLRTLRKRPRLKSRTTGRVPDRTGDPIQALAEVNMDAVEQLAMSVADLFGPVLTTLSPSALGISGIAGRDPVTAALCCIWLALESCFGRPCSLSKMTEMLTKVLRAPSPEALTESLVSNGPDNPNGTIQNKYEVLLNLLRKSCEGLDWALTTTTRYQRRGKTSRGRDAFWDQPRGVQRSWNAAEVPRADLIQHAATIISVRVAEKNRVAQDQRNDHRSSTTEVPFNLERSSARPSAPTIEDDSLVPSLTSLRGISSWATLDSLPPNERDTFLFSPGELEQYIRSPEDQADYLEALAEMYPDSDQEESESELPDGDQGADEGSERSEEEIGMIGNLHDVPKGSNYDFPIWSEELGY